MHKHPHPDFGVYLHIPFCEKKCVYCDFYSIEKMEHMDIFISQIIKEIKYTSQQSQQYFRPATSIFFGGGTPSLLSAIQMQKIINEIHTSIAIHPNAEWTMECNPGTITLDSLKAYKDLGINRLSFGIQSFNQKELDFLHRIHSPMESIEAVSLARQAGFDNINIDLIFALPDQQMNSWKQTLEMAIELQTEHISAYSLIFEEKTPLYTMLQKGLVKPSEEEKDADMYAYTIETLISAGYSQYEVSNFAKDGYSCVHNRTYWQAREYIAFGPSAHGFLHNKRYWNYRNLIRYFEAVEKNGKGEANVEELSAYNRLFETVFLSFRAEGLNINEINTEFDIDILSILEKEFALWKQEKLIELHDSMISLTAKGYALCDELSVRIIASLEVFLGQEWDNQGYQEDESEEEDTIVYTLPILEV